MGAVMLVRRAAIDEVGPLDEDFFLFSEETDWCFRFRQAGWQVWFTPDAEFVHVYGAAHGGRLFRENVRGHLRFLAKHQGSGRRSARAGSCAPAACSARRATGSTCVSRAGSRRDRSRSSCARSDSPRRIRRGGAPRGRTLAAPAGPRRRTVRASRRGDARGARAGRDRARARTADGSRDARMDARGARRGARRRLPRAHVVRARPVAAARRHGDRAGRAGARARAADPATLDRGGRRTRARRSPLARRADGARGRQPVPPRARAQARRSRVAVALADGRARTRRSASGLRVSALARVPRRGVEARGCRPGARRPARERPASAARCRDRVRGRLRALRLRGTRRRGGRRADRARRLRGGSRRHVSAARASGADGATAARAGRARARVRVRARARDAAARERRRRVGGARARASDLRGVPLHPARGLARRRAARGAAHRLADRSRARSGRRPDGRRLARAASDRARHRLARAVVGRAAARARALPGPARRARLELPPRAGSLRAERRRCRRGARARTARGARVAAPLGAARARRVGRGARRDARAVPVRAPVRRVVAVAVASRSGVPAVRVRVRGRRLGSQFPARDLRAAARAAAGVVFQTLWPGDFGFRLENGGPGEVVWFAAAAGLSRSSCRRSRAACRSTERAGYRA